MSNISAYSKGIVGALGAILLAVQVAVGNGVGISASEWVTIAIAAVAAIGVYLVPNSSGAPGDGGNPAGTGDDTGTELTS